MSIYNVLQPTLDCERKRSPPLLLALLILQSPSSSSGWKKKVSALNDTHYLVLFPSIKHVVKVQLGQREDLGKVKDGNKNGNASFKQMWRN